MLIDFRVLFPKYGINPKGVLHIGGNVGEEFPVYMELGITNQCWFEPNPEIFKKLERNISVNASAIAFQYCVGDRDVNVVLHESNNAGQSSSILELGTHKIAHPEVHYINDIPVRMVRIDTFFADTPFDYDFLNIDIQGAELLALKGMGDMLHNFKWAYLEVNWKELYIGCALFDEVVEYMANYGFKVAEYLQCGQTSWGDCLFIK